MRAKDPRCIGASVDRGVESGSRIGKASVVRTEPLSETGSMASTSIER